MRSRARAPVPLLTDLPSRAAYAEGAGMYRIVPQAVARIETVDEARRLVAWAADTGTPLVPRGAGSGMPGHNVGRGVVVDLSSCKSLEVNQRDRLIRAGPGVTWAEVTDAARPHGLRLPPDPSSGSFATSGAMVATNAAGPRSVKYGSVRRWVEAVEVVGVDGTVRVVKRGGGSGEWFALDEAGRRIAETSFPRTRKNSGGYALDPFARSGDELDLFVGSEGTLGIVTAVHWRLDPIPPDAAGLAVGLQDLATLGDAVTYLVALNPSAVELLDRTLLDMAGDVTAGLPTALACVLLVEFERDTAAAARGVVGDAVRGLHGLAAHIETAPDRTGLERLWTMRRAASPALARLPATRRSLQLIEDGCVPLERLGEYVAGLRAAAARHDVPVVVFGHAGDGHVHANVLPDLTRPDWRDALAAVFDEVTELVGRLGGTPSGEHGIGRLRAGVLERFVGREAMDLMRAVKTAYDPAGILNPGVILPAADWAPLADLKVGPAAAPIPDDIAARLREVERAAAWATPKASLTTRAPNP